MAFKITAPTFRTILEPDEGAARVITVLRADGKYSVHAQRAVLAVFLAARADDLQELPVESPITIGSKGPSAAG